jgi:hypothetical protein
MERLTVSWRGRNARVRRWHAVAVAKPLLLLLT